MNGEEIRFVHFPQGHSDSDAMVWFWDAGVVHLGDIFWPGVFPFIDVENGGSVEGLIENVGKLIESLPADVKIIPGHGPVSNIQGLKEYHRMLVESTDWIRKQGQDKKYFEDIYRAFPKGWQTWGQGYISSAAWTEIVLYSYGMRKADNA